ncbi:unnamed protein product [Caenorhabditis bovis]|uniref:PLD phosphodiesterase domain-containing protein n=1 Tax=Caenorhabditis bovis TaxID=2654633 RepID=A0A8S1E8X4_9PELO|nr:unnamed protein product [Caenorhabditis bovis]
MGFGPSFWSHSLVAVVSVLLTSAIWLTAYFAGIQPNLNKGITNNNITNNYCNSTSQTCQKAEMPKCADTCEFVICESIPAGMQFDPKYPIFNTTTDCWLRLMQEAKQEILIASYYWSLLLKDADGFTDDRANTSFNGQLIYDTLLKTAVEKNIPIRIAQTYDKDGYVETADLVTNSKGKIEVRSLDFTQWYPGGILHTKSWSVDSNHFYIGSANFDWRSLTQVKELGIAVFNCPCMGEDLKKLLEIYWQMGAPGAKLPQQWDSKLATPANHENPMSVNQPTGNEAIYISASPPGFQACGREDDLAAMIKSIDDAKEYLNMAVMDYSPTTLYMKNANKWMPALDNAIRRAAFERAVKVRFMLSLWPHTYNDAYGLMYSLQDISKNLPCYQYKNDICTKKGSIEVRFIEVPSMKDIYGDIPYARVYHNKYFTTESTAYIGTSNWSADYWEYTAGIGFIIRADDTSVKSRLVQDLTSIFERDWNSIYTIPLNQFDISGNRTTIV